MDPSSSVDPSSDPQRQAARSLSANFVWMLIGNLTNGLSQWLILVVLAKHGSPVDVGQLALGLALTGPVFTFLSLQLRVVQGTDARGRFVFGEYLALRMLTTLAALVAVTAIVLVGRYSLQVALVVWLVAIARAAETMSDLIYGLLQRRERLDRVGQSLVLRGVLTIAGLAATLRFVQGATAAAAVLSVAWLALLFAFDVRNAAAVLRASDAHASVAPSWEPRHLWELARTALPLGIVATLVSFNSNVPRYFIHHALGDYELGLFSAIVYTQLVGGTLVGALGHAATPRLANHYARREERAFREHFRRLLLFAAAVGVGGVAFALVAGRVGLTLLFSSEYAARVGLFVLVMVWAAIGYLLSVVGYALNAAQYFRSQAVLFGLALAVTALGCWLLVPRFGSSGAVVALIASSTVTLIAALFPLARVLRECRSGRDPQLAIDAVE